MSALTAALAAATSTLAASTIALAAVQHRLRRRLRDAVHDARTDALTGIGNRRAFLAALDMGIAAHPGRVGVVLVDLDRFKTINDTFGHAGGDLVLCEVGRRLTRLDPGITVAARLGGDEFALLVVGDPDAGLAVGKLAWQAISNHPIRIGAHSAAVYACAGTATHTPGLTPADLLRRADIALYHAKHNGPVTRYPPTSGNPAPPPGGRGVRDHHPPDPPRPDRGAEHHRRPPDTHP
jgi:diguanylate cyclase (GGDEF)-like protein